ncbi:MAG TPA: glycosyltransferase family 39 protein [Chloroflexia bacterium]|nr:glycosyltransferase family 39 protein [Chloroflexia bacterium]
MNGRLSRVALLDGLTVGLAAALFLALTTYQIRLPGLYYDEAWDAVSTMHLIQGTPVELDRGAHLALFGRQWPLMLDDYQGIISSYLLVPFFLLGGINVEALRAFPIVSGLIAVVLCFLLARAWFGRRAARIAVLLFAVAPSWVFWSRLGVYVVAEVVPFTLGALLAFTAWWRAPRGRNGLLYVGSFLLGLGLATKLLYIWPIVAAIVCYGLLHGRKLWQRRRDGLPALRPAWGALGSRAHPFVPLLVAAACFAAGAFPFLAFNWQTHGTYLKIRGSLFQTEYGTSNTTVLPNLWEETDRFRQLLDGGYFWFQGEADQPGQVGRVYKDPLGGAAFLLAALGMLAAAVRTLPATRPDAAGSRRPWGWACLAAGAALALAGAAAMRPDSRAVTLILPAALTALAGMGAAVVLLRGALHDPPGWARAAGSGLLGSMVLSGVAWWFTGRPDGQARTLLDLRVADLTGVLFWISLFALLALLGWSAPTRVWQRPLVATLGFLAAVLAQSFPTLSGLWATHLLVMLPFPQILIGIAVVVLGEGLAGSRQRAAPAPLAVNHVLPASSPWPARGLVLALAAALLASALWTDVRYHRDLARSGGVFAFSDGIYTLANYLRKAADYPVVAAEWGIRRQLQILSQGRLDPEEIFQYPFDATPATLGAFDEALGETLKDPNARYVFTAGTIGPARRFPEFERVLKERGLVPVLQHTSYMRNGLPVYEVFTAGRAP